ncbi:hypothetical protein [Desulfobacca acetoxidans]
MPSSLNDYLNKLTPQEKAELETFAAFLIARRGLRSSAILADEIPMAELMALAMQSFSFDWLADADEDIYGPTDGGEATWLRE